MKPLFETGSWMCCALLACQAGPSEPLDAPTSEAQRDAEQASIEPGSVPADLDAIQSLLQARHTEDLPSAEQLASYPSAEASLQQLAQHGETMLIRTRALLLLRHFGSAATGVLLLDIVGDAQAHPALRAAAVGGLAGQPLEDQPEQLATVVAALRDGDPRVGLAAVEMLDAFPAGRQALRRATRDQQLADEVRAAIDSR
jgi:hypothetical protein